MTKIQILPSPAAPDSKTRSFFGRPIGFLLATVIMIVAAAISVWMTRSTESLIFPWLPAGIAAGLTLRYGSRYALLGGLTLAAAAAADLAGWTGFPTSSEPRSRFAITAMLVLLPTAHALGLAALPLIMGKAGRNILNGQVTPGDATRFVLLAVPLTVLPVVLVTMGPSIIHGEIPANGMNTPVALILGFLATTPISITLLPDARGYRVYRCHSRQRRRFIPAILLVATTVGSWWGPDLDHDPTRVLFMLALLAFFSWLATQSGWFACSMGLVVVAFCESTSAFGSSFMLLPLMSFGVFIAATMEERFRNDLHARDQKDQVMSLIDATSAAVIEIDLAGDLRFGNIAAMDLLENAPFPVVTGKPILNAFDSPSRRRLLAAVRVALAGRPRECEITIRGESGPTYLAILTPLHRGSFGIHGCSMVLLDLASTRRRARRRERRREQKFSSLAHAIVHDVNNFAMEVGGVASLARGQADETVKEVLAGIEESCLQAARRTDRIRHLVQTAEDAPLIDLGRILGERLRHHHSTERIRIGVVSDGLGAMVRLTESFAGFIVDEFVENAIEASEDGLPEITLICRSTGEGEIEIRMADNGPGIPASIRPQIGKTPVSTRGGGRGLGLRAISDGVRSTGGRVVITSSHLGTMLKVFLPVGTLRQQTNPSQKDVPALAT
jgi:nitrogen-specific signal transduction histidine kinase